MLSFRRDDSKSFLHYVTLKSTKIINDHGVTTRVNMPKSIRERRKVSLLRWKLVSFNGFSLCPCETVNWAVLGFVLSWTWTFKMWVVWKLKGYADAANAGFGSRFFNSYTELHFVGISENLNTSISEIRTFYTKKPVFQKSWLIECKLFKTPGVFCLNWKIIWLKDLLNIKLVLW